MKRFAVLLFLLSIRFCFADPCTGTPGTVTPPGTHPGDYTLSDGCVETVQKAVDDIAIVAGDRILIPNASSPYHWTKPLLVGNGTGPSGARVPKNIKIRGDCYATCTVPNNSALPKIYNVPEDNMVNFIQFTVEDTSPQTAEIGNIELNGTTQSTDNEKIEVFGVSRIKIVSGAYVGGIRIHDVRFALPYYYANLSGSTPRTLPEISMTDAGTSNGSNVLTSNSASFTAQRIWDPGVNKWAITDVGRVIFVDGGSTTNVIPLWDTISLIGYNLTDAMVTGGSKTLTSASANFSSADLNAPIVGTNIPSNATASPTPIAYVQTVTDAHTIQMSVASTAPGATPVQITANIQNPHQVQLFTPATGSAAGHTVAVAGVMTRGVGDNSGHGWFGTHGWVEGVMDHCEQDCNIRRYCTGNGEVNNYTDLSGSGAYGDYAYFYPDVGQQPIPGSLHGFYFEDNVSHYGGGGITDSKAQQGGGILYFRHNTIWGGTNWHGTRETGAGEWSGRWMEDYNNHYIILGPVQSGGWAPANQTEQGKADTGATELRGGSGLAYNNYITCGPNYALSNNGTQCWFINVSPGVAGFIPNYNRWFWGADALSPWDDNAHDTGSGYTSLQGSTHWVFDTYNHTFPPSYTGPSGSVQDTTYYNGGDIVTNGKDTTLAQLSDVFGTVTMRANGADGLSDGGSTITHAAGSTACDGMNTGNAAAAEGAQCLYHVKVAGKWLSGQNGVPASSATPIPANYFRGFTIRNPNVSRNAGASAPKLGCYSYIVRSNQGTGTNGDVVSMVLRSCNPFNDGYSPLFDTVTAGPFEIRCVNRYLGAQGGGKLTQQLNGGNPVKLLNPPNPTFPYPTTFIQNTDGIYSWGNYRRGISPTGVIGSWGHEIKDPRTNGDTGQYTLIVRGRSEYVTGPATCVMQNSYAGPTPPCADGTPSPRGMQPLFDNSSYPWNPNVTPSATDPTQRVGADWGKQFFDHNVMTADTRPVSAGNTFSPWEASFPLPTASPSTLLFSSSVGVGGAPYPHPLVSAPTPSAPTITSTPSATWTSGVANSFTVQTSGFPAPTIAPSPAPTPPSFVNFTDNHDGTATMSGTPPSTVGSPFSFNITASNGNLPNAVQPFTLTIVAPNGITLTSPANGATFYTADPSITTAPVNLAATVTGPGGATVLFKDGGTIINTDTTPPYAFTWNAPLGTHDLHATTGAIDSNHAAITVATPSPTPTPGASPTPATIVVKP